jgi:hypothetical protein
LDQGRWRGGVSGYAEILRRFHFPYSMLSFFICYCGGHGYKHNDR